jgi:aryl-alcohol dehydrogenase-like predicted oxidoreductase
VATVVNFKTSAFVPLALGFFRLGTGSLIHGPHELVGFPARDRRVDPTRGAAYDAGVRDAPSDGRAEEFLGRWLRSRRPEGVTVGSKWSYVYTAG